jgi:aryl-alcohol dehydrogenase-like predicted oxidoreductase
MDFTYLGRTGLRVSRLCLGTMNFGPRTSEEDAHAIMDVAHEVGINFFDTANRYGSEPGETETIIGNWFASGGGRRERTVIATKVYGEMGSWPNEGKLSALNIRRALDASLAPAADRLCRSLPVSPHRSEHTLGGDLAGDRGGGAGGQDPLRRQ